MFMFLCTLLLQDEIFASTITFFQLMKQLVEFLADEVVHYGVKISIALDLWKK